MAIPTLRNKNQITIPAKLVHSVGLNVGDPVEIKVERGRIVIKAYLSSRDWFTEDVMAEIDEAANGPFQVFSSMDELERNMNV